MISCLKCHSVRHFSWTPYPVLYKGRFVCFLRWFTFDGDGEQSKVMWSALSSREFPSSYPVILYMDYSTSWKYEADWQNGTVTPLISMLHLQSANWNNVLILSKLDLTGVITYHGPIETTKCKRTEDNVLITVVLMGTDTQLNRLYYICRSTPMIYWLSWYCI